MHHGVDIFQHGRRDASQIAANRCCARCVDGGIRFFGARQCEHLMRFAQFPRRRAAHETRRTRDKNAHTALPLAGEAEMTAPGIPGILAVRA